jgi:predicted DNA-binding protein with PD1-like motif
MIYKKFNNNLIIRVEKDEDIVEVLFEIIEKENITLGTLSGIGSVNHVELGLFNTLDCIYSKKEFRGDFEIVSLCGNISTMEHKPYLHLHMAIADNKQYTFGGHLTKAVVSATAELIVNIIDGKIDRYFDEEIGLNLMKFD